MFSFLRRGPQDLPPSVTDLAAALSRNEIHLVDVREPSELQKTGKAKGAVNLPLGLLALRADPAAPDAMLRPGKPVAVYCAAGARSAQGAQLLRRLGYDPVWNIGGLGDWVAGGGQVEQV
jgi:rhodanese-related sulfurtransferase